MPDQTPGQDTAARRPAPRPPEQTEKANRLVASLLVAVAVLLLAGAFGVVFLVRSGAF